MDFPSTPIVGQLYSFAGRTWRFDGAGWQRVVNQGQIVSVFTLVQVNEALVTTLPTTPNAWHLINHL